MLLYSCIALNVFRHIYELLIKFVGSQHISSANLLACLGVLTTIAKNRPEFMMTTVATIESLHSNLPPTLTTTQVNSVRKKLKSELMGLIKHPAAFEYADTITKILTDLGKWFILIYSVLWFSISCF